MLAGLAAAQHGAVHRDQLAAIGLDRRAIRRRVDRHQLHQLTADTFAVGHTAVSRRGRTTAAFLQLGDRGAVSHRSAARSWGLVDEERGGEIHISVIDRGNIALPPGVTLHRPRTLTADDITIHRGFPTTSPERTLCDELPGKAVTDVTRMLERMVTEVGRDPDELHRWAAALRHIEGKAALDRALEHVVGPVILRSRLETEFRSICQRAGLPPALTNTKLGFWEVDVLWPEHRLIVELDSWRFHGGKWAFHRDRRKGLALAGDGYEVIRLTWAQVKYDTDLVVAVLARVLERRARLAA